MPREISVIHATHEQYSTPVADWVSRYTKTRLLMDYNYHPYYTPQRQLLQDEIIGKYVEEQSLLGCSHPWVLFTSGVMGAGKSHALRVLGENCGFPLSRFGIVDPDRLKYELPEMNTFVNTVPAEAGSLTHMESGYLSEIITLEMMNRSRNIVVDGSVSDGPWFKNYIDFLRGHYPSYRFGIIYIRADRDTVFERVKRRGKETGRFIPEKKLLHAFDAVPKAMALLRGDVESFVEIVNNGEKPVIRSEFLGQWKSLCANLLGNQ